MAKRFLVIDEYPCPARVEAPKFRVMTTCDETMLDDADIYMRWKVEAGVCPVTHERFDFDDPKRKRIVRELEEWERGP